MLPTLLLGALCLYLAYAVLVAGIVIKAVIDDGQDFNGILDVVVSIGVALAIGLGWPYLAARLLYWSTRDDD